MTVSVHVARYIQSLDPSQYYTNKENMSTHRTWDESRSPQWRYFLQREASQKRKTRKDLEVERARTRLEEGAPPKKRIKKKGKKTAIKKYVRIDGELRQKITEQLHNELIHDDTDTTTRLSTESKEQE